jgi:hypothetical protein
MKQIWLSKKIKCWDLFLVDLDKVLPFPVTGAEICHKIIHFSIISIHLYFILIFEVGIVVLVQ